MQRRDAASYLVRVHTYFLSTSWTWLGRPILRFQPRQHLFYRVFGSFAFGALHGLLDVAERFGFATAIIVEVNNTMGLLFVAHNVMIGGANHIVDPSGCAFKFSGRTASNG